jgi:hypothetical protein
MFSGRFNLQLDDQKRVFIDRDGSNFKYILNYLRASGDLEKFYIPWENDQIVKEVIFEAEYYNLTALREVLVNKGKRGIFGSKLLNSEHAKLLSAWLQSSSKWTVIYRGSTDGFAAADFHRSCNNKGETITLVQTESGHLFGGYTPITWTSRGNYVFDNRTFIFTLVNAEHAAPMMIPNSGPLHANQHSIYDHANYGPSFGGGHDIYISNNCNADNSSYTNLGHSFSVTGKTYNSTDIKQFLCGSYQFKVKEIEVLAKDSEK